MLFGLFYNCNGVRQGGILTPMLFILSVNQLIGKLIACNAGYYFNSMCINHVMYVDDICLLALTASEMQSLQNVCYEYGTDNDNLFNPNKSICTVFKLKAYKPFISDDFYLSKKTMTSIGHASCTWPNKRVCPKSDQKHTVFRLIIKVTEKTGNN